jgi:hypothetical protein
MFTLLFDRASEVLLARFSGVFTTEDFHELDDALIHFLSGEGQAFADRVRAIFDLSDVEAIAVPESRAAEQASRPPIVHGVRVVVAPRNAGDEFGQTYRRHQRLAVDSEPVIVATLAAAYALLGLENPRFEAVEQT